MRQAIGSMGLFVGGQNILDLRCELLGLDTGSDCVRGLTAVIMGHLC